MAHRDRSRIRTLRRLAGVALTLSIASAVGSISILVAHGLEWLLTGAMTHVFLADLLRVDSVWLRVPLCLVVPLVAFSTLYLFFGAWSVAMRKDMQSAAPRP